MTPLPDARRQAHHYLCMMLNQQRALSHLFTPQDSAFTKELCFGVSRYHQVLERLLAHYVKKKPKDNEVWVALLMGAYQLCVLNKPDYAVVKETVGVLEKTHFVYAKGFVNGVLRQLGRERDKGCDHFQLELAKGSAPAWLEKQLRLDWPTDWQHVVQANLQQAPMILRVNAQKISREDYLSQLTELGMQATPHPLLASAIILEKACAVDSLPGFLQGWVSVQDAAAQLALQLLALTPELRVLDACAAPGGKTCHLLEAMPSLQACVAVEKDAERSSRIHDNLARLQLTAQVLVGDATQPDSWWDGVPFDRILLDAPCSATGVIRRHPDVQVRRTPHEVKVISELQGQLLQSLWPLLKPGGRLVYVTCSVLKQENDAQVGAFLEGTLDAVTQPMTLPWGRKTRYGWQVLPGEAEGDGFFYAVIDKTGI
ncbi:MAG: 16S rRNA (cytosine(967)-C(5))-methyltransferase RsmB [Gammaproteobacteria bacterium]|nr:16S rRNA (cytosine(967)-C(5))-methyltransferase RsmB [Gammaproteobacteria bacterium]